MAHPWCHDRVNSSPQLSVLAPALPEKRAPQQFPIVAAVAPVVMGLVIWAITQSVLSLLFAGLGPLIAVASLVDGRVQSRRAARLGAARFDRELAAARAELRVAHDAERGMLARESPSASELIVRTPATCWSAPPRVRLGLGRSASAVVVEGAAPATREESREHGLLAAFLADARQLADAPVAIDLAPLVTRGGALGVVGMDVAGRALHRALVLHLAAVLAPDTWGLAVGPGAEAWLDALPHRARAAPETGIAFTRGDGTSIRLLLVDRRSDLPTDCAVTVVADGGAVVAEFDGTRVVLDVLERVSTAQALAWALRCSHEARSLGLSVGETLADAVPFDAESEGAVIGHDGSRSVTVDLVADGPHAVVGGTTGSGKSELLTTWVLALAARQSPDEVTFLLVDFKGGATFGPIAHLPHCVGVLTDLDAAAAERAFESLSAEVRYREALLTTQGVRDIADARGLPRLVIVVDEFAALATASPHLHALFADLAARGRSLGIHLILCTQRPAGVVRDAVLANVGLRISLRVHDRADSSAVIGTPDAATLPTHPRGRAYIASGGAPPRLVQLALVAPADIAAVAERWQEAAPPRRPWCEPLPTTIPLASLPRTTGAITLGRSDHPHEQSQPLATWSPAADGNLLVVGAARAGTSTALETVAAGARRARFVRGDPLATWDVVTRALEETRGGVAREQLVVLDDLDVSLGRLGPEHAAALLERLQSLLREGPAAGIHCAIGVQRVTGALSPLVSLCGARLLLRLADRQEHVFAGGVASDFSAELPAGRGIWRGRVTQVAIGADPIERVVAEVTVVDAPFAAVVANPRAFIERARHLGLRAERIDAGTLTITAGEPRILVGDPDEWQAHWGALPRLGQTHPLVIDGCSLAEYRAATRQRDLPPPLSGRAGEFWLLDPDGTPRRATLPRTPPSSASLASDSAQNMPDDPLI